MLKVWTKA